jgi:hypothetical protein
MCIRVISITDLSTKKSLHLDPGILSIGIGCPKDCYMIKLSLSIGCTDMNEDAKLGHVRCYCAQEIYHMHQVNGSSCNSEQNSFLCSNLVRCTKNRRTLSKAKAYVVLAKFNIFNSQYYQNLK